MIERKMIIQVAMKLTFRDKCDEAPNPPVVRIYNESDVFMWRVTPDHVSSSVFDGIPIPSEVLFHARQFLYDNHPELGPQPT